MSFGSTEPTRKSQTGLQLEWDCSQNEGAVSQLVNSWVAVLDGAGGGSGHAPVLDEKERHTVADILRTNTSEAAHKIESLLRIDMVYFTRVRSQLLSLLIAWEQVMLEKRRYDEEGFHIGNAETQLSPRQFMVLFQIVYHRAQAGIPDLPTSISGSAAPAKLFLPPEIWLMITSWLGPSDTMRFLATHRHAQSAFTNRQLEHAKLRSRIFIDDLWTTKALAYGLQPVIFGRDGEDGTDPYLILALAGDMAEIPAELRDLKTLLQSFRSRAFSLENLEITFSKFTLNVCHVLELSKVIDVPDPAHLFQDKSDMTNLSVTYYAEMLSQSHPIHIIDSSVAIHIPRFKGQKTWIIRPRRNEPDIRRLQKSPIGIPLK